MNYAEFEITDQPNSPVCLQNQDCPYCFAELDDTNANVEHVIGRRFVPNGSTENSWNLILRACQSCNAAKANLEDDISAITMFNQGGDDPLLLDDIKRKTGHVTRGSISDRTGKPVSQSDESVTINGNPLRVTSHGGLRDVTGEHLPFTPVAADLHFNAGLIGPPQIDAQRIEALAQFHIKAMVYFLAEKAGGIFLAEPGERDVGILMVNHAPKQDWGNSYQTSFRDQMHAWHQQRMIVHAAGGYFKCLIRGNPNAPLMAWALEWNKSYRIIGYIGQAALLHAEAGRLTPTTFRQLNSTYRFRREVGLQEEVDTLFSFDGE